MISTPFLDARSVVRLNVPTRGPSMPRALASIANAPYFEWLEIIIARSRPRDGAYKEGGKRARFIPRRAPTVAEIRGHFTGGMRKVGAYPMRIGSSVTMLWTIDLDDHDGTLGWAELCRRADAVMAQLAKKGLCPARFRSSGGKGIHLWGYWDEPQDAYSARQQLKQCVLAAGLPVRAGVAEIFPAQDSILEGRCGTVVFWPIERLDTGEWLPSAPVPVVEPPERTSASNVFTGELALLREATMAIPNGGEGGDEEQPYGEGEFGYLKVGMGLHDATGGGDEGLELWHEWSAQSSKYDHRDVDRRWRGFKAGGGITARSIFAEARKHGWEEPVDLNRMFGDAAAGGSDDPAAGVGPRLPQARHLCTDQANAGRLLRAAGSQVMFAAGRWYFWTGTHWAADEDAAYRLACGLSTLILAEADAWELRPAGSAEETDNNHKIAKSLRGWAKQSEMKNRIDAAFGLLRRLVAKPAAELDSDPYLLNVANGTIDLKTGELRPHDAADHITKIITIEYKPDASAPGFEKALAEVTGEAGFVKKPLAEFLQRWFGYCATGLVSEDALAIHHGDGGNGKTLVMGLVAWVLGPYAGTAAPDLVVGAQQSHPTGVADLAGKRMVTAVESGEGGTLREDFVKRATGRDRIKARYMRQDFFEFDPTHKLQLVTNHRPQIRGQDAGIWRRVLLIPYEVKFGRPEEVAAGNAHHLRDEGLEERLKAEGPGILSWLVRGALAWRATGLQPPDAVRAAGRSYREEQDRVGQFIAECCERDPDAWTPLSGPAGLYPEYQTWCKDSGYQPLGRSKFQEAVEKRPGIREEKKRPPPSYKSLLGFAGLRLVVGVDWQQSR